jgi:lysophospholipase L1-like esterase
MAPYPVIQRGYGGAKLSDLVIYAERIIYPHQFGAIVIFIANDIAGKEEDKDPREVARLFRHVLQIIRAKYADSPVFWIAITPTPQRWQVWPLIAEANKRIEEICSKHDNTYFIRTDSAFLNESSQPREELFMPDRLHLNSQGYAVWTAIIKEALENVLSGKLRPQTVPDL